MHVRRSLAVLVVLVLSAQAGLSEDAKECVKTLEALRDASDKLQEIEGATDEQKQELETLWLDMKKNSDALIRAVNKKGKAPPAAYHKSIQRNQKALDHALGGKLKVEKRLAICRAIAKDLQVKAAFARKNPDAPTRLVKVTVRTLNGDREENGYYVWAISAGSYEAGERADPFDRMSSPTEKLLPPGQYYMWTSVPNKDAQSEPLSRPVGLPGIVEQTIDLVVPKQ